METIDRREPVGGRMKAEELQQVMVVVAHPDDMEFGCAGTVAKFIRDGKQVVLIQCTSGDKGTARRDITSEELSAMREAEEREACRRLGIAEVRFLRLGDGELVPDLAFREKVVRCIREYRPDIVITHDPFRPYSLHADHRAVGITTVDAVYPTARDPLYFPEHGEDGLEPHKVAELWLFGAEYPDTYVDISETFGEKLNALRAHSSQVGDGNGLEDRLRQRAADAGAARGIELAEIFKVITMRR